MGIIAKYKFNQNTYENLLPVFNDGFTYTFSDSIDTDGYTIRTIESDTLPTLIKFGSGSGGLTSTQASSLLSVEYIDTSNVTDMSNMFYGCSKLTSLDLSNFDTSKVTTMTGMFYNCSSLTSLDVSSFNTSQVTSMKEMFSECTSLTSLDVSSFNTIQVINMREMFYNCSLLTSLDVSNFNTSQVTYIDSMFYNCSSLTSLDLTHFDTSKVTSMSSMFGAWSSSQKVYISSKWTLGTNFPPTFVLTFANRIAKYKFNQNTYESFIPKFNSKFTDYTYTDEIDTDGYTIRTIGNDSGELPTIIRFGYTSGGITTTQASSLLSVEYVNTSNITYMSNMFSDCSKLTSLDLSNFDTSKVTTMNSMFYNCTSLTSLDLSNFDTSKVTDMSYMFYNCSSLTSLDLTHFDTSKVTSMSSMFGVWSSSQKVYISSKWTLGTNFPPTFVLTFANIIAKYKFNQNTYESLLPEFNSGFTDYTYNDEIDTDGYTIRTIGNDSDNLPTLIRFGYISGGITTTQAKSLLSIEYINTSNVTDMNSMFRNCTSLTSLDVSNFDTGKVTDMCCMFHSCSALTSLDVSNFDTSSVTDMASMFRDCTSLTSLDLSSFNTNQVTNMTGMFYNCSSLTSLNVSNFNTNQVTDMSDMFRDCSKLTSLYLTNFDTSKVTSSKNTFTGITSSTTVYLNARTWNIDVSSYSANFIREITYKHIIAKYTFNNTVADCLPTITGATTSQWEYCDIPEGNITTRTIGTDEELTITNISFQNKTSLLTLDYLNFTNTITNTTSMFHGCTALTSIIALNFNTSSVTNMGSMFYNCSNLQTLDTSNWDTSKVTTMNNMFYNCSNLQNLDVSKWNTLNVNNTNSMFHSCSNLQSLDVSKWNTSSVTDMNNMFKNCSNLQTLDVSKWDISKVTTIHNMFNGCSKLQALDVSNWLTSKVTDMSYMFSNCSNLTTLDVSNFNTSNVINMTYIFEGCSNLTTIDVSNWDTSKIDNMQGMFYSCAKLQTIDVSSFNTSKVATMENMFNGCSNLTTLDISNFNASSVTNVNNMFRNCSILKAIGMLYSNTESINKLVELHKPNGLVVYYYDADPTNLTPVEGVTFKKYEMPTTIQLPPHIQLHSLPDGTRDEVDIKTGILIRRTQKIDNEIVALESPITEQLILNYNNSCDYGRILPTGMCDKYDVVNSMYTQTMTSILLDGENTWDAMEEMTNVVKFTATGTTVGVENLNMLGAGGLYCDNDLFPNINDDSDVEHCRVDEAGNKFYIYISKDRLMSPDLIGWQIWLQTNKFNMVYELAEHITYNKPYEELDPTQARWEGMDCVRDGVIKYHVNNSDNITIYPTLEYVAPSINNFEVPMLEPNTEYTIYAKGINDNDIINLGGTNINFKDGKVFTSGNNQWLRINNNDSFYNMVITKGDTTGEAVPYFEGMVSVENPKVQCGGSIVSYTNLKLRSLPNGVKDTINVVTGEYVQRVGERKYQVGDLENENVLTDGINTVYELKDYITTKLDPQTLLAYTDGTINLSSDTGLLPTTHYTVPSTNTFRLPSMKTGTRYTLKYPSASGSITIGDINYSISSDSMLFTTPLKINGDTSAIIFSDANPENVILLEGAYNKREVPFFTGVKSVKNPNITIIDQLSMKSTTYNCATEIELRGLPNGVADKLDIIKGKLTTNVGIRPYQEGDENLSNIWTDGHETVYALNNPVVTNVAIDHPTVTTNSLIALSSDYLIPQLNYRALSSNNFPLDLLQPNQTYTLYADTLTSGSYTLGGTKTGIYSQPHTITLGDMTDNLLTFNGDLGLSNVMLVKGNSLKTTLPPYFLGIRSVTDGHLLIEGMAGEINEITFDEGITLRDCNGVKDTIDLITGTLTKRTGEITLTGEEGWRRVENESTTNYNVFKLTLGGLKKALVICDTLQSVSDAKVMDCIYAHTNELCIVIANATIGGDTVNALKSWLNQHPTTVVYQLSTPIEVQLENIWTTLPPTSYNNQTEISSTVSSTSLKPMISVTIATTTLEEIVSQLEQQNEELENENVTTMLALTSFYETFAVPITSDEPSTINLSDGKDSSNLNGMSVSPMSMIYAKLIKKGLKTIEQVPTNLQVEVKYVLKE